MQYTTVSKPEMQVIGISVRTCNDVEPKEIPKLWDRFNSEAIMAQIPNKTSNEVIAFYCEYEGNYTKPYTLMLGAEVSSIEDIPKGMVAKTIPASSYALFHVTGEFPARLIETWQYVWKELESKRTYSGDFELYSEEFFAGKTQEIQLYIAISK